MTAVPFGDLLAIVWKRRLIVAAVFVACVAVAGAYAFTRAKQYESTSTIAFTPDSSKGQQFIPSDNLSALISTYAEVAQSDTIAARARQLLGRPVPGEIDASTGAGSGILDVIGKDTSPQGAADAARATAEALVRSIANNGLVVPSIVNPATANPTPLQPRPPLILTVAALLGLVGGILLALARESFRRTIETSVEVSELAQTPVLGRLPRTRALQRGAARTVWDDPSLTVLQEGYRTLRTNVELLMDEHGIQTEVGTGETLQVTSADSGDGKSTVVSNLAIAFGQLGVETLVIDADLRRPRQHEIFGVGNDQGLSTALTLPSSTLPSQPTRFPSVSVLPSGPIPPNASELLHIRFRGVLRLAQQQAQMVIVDSPPVLPVSDARMIAPASDALIFVVGAHKTRTAAVASALDKLRFAQPNMLGVVLNLADGDDADTTTYGYGPAQSVQVDRDRSRGPMSVG